MTPETVQKLSAAIDARVRAELAWQECMNDRRGQLDEHRPVFERLRRARRAVSRILEREFDPQTFDKVARAARRAMVSSVASAEDFE